VPDLVSDVNSPRDVDNSFCLWPGNSMQNR
jgi:hypothetical protein